MNHIQENTFFLCHFYPFVKIQNGGDKSDKSSTTGALTKRALFEVAALHTSLQHIYIVRPLVVWGIVVAGKLSWLCPVQLLEDAPVIEIMYKW
jgi:hypothetical protein